MTTEKFYLERVVHYRVETVILAGNGAIPLKGGAAAFRAKKKEFYNPSFLQTNHRNYIIKSLVTWFSKSYSIYSFHKYLYPFRHRGTLSLVATICSSRLLLQR